MFREPSEVRLWMRDLLAVLETHWCPSAGFCFLVGLLSPWNITHFHFQFHLLCILRILNPYMLEVYWEWRDLTKQVYPGKVVAPVPSQEPLIFVSRVCLDFFLSFFIIYVFMSIGIFFIMTHLKSTFCSGVFTLFWRLNSGLWLFAVLWSSWCLFDTIPISITADSIANREHTMRYTYKEREHKFYTGTCTFSMADLV